jgi:hypothetical protein
MQAASLLYTGGFKHIFWPTKIRTAKLAVVDFREGRLGEIPNLHSRGSKPTLTWHGLSAGKAAGSARVSSGTPLQQAFVFRGPNNAARETALSALSTGMMVSTTRRTEQRAQSVWEDRDARPSAFAAQDAYHD